MKMYVFISFQYKSNHAEHSTIAASVRPKADWFWSPFSVRLKARTGLRCGGRVGQQERWEVFRHSVHSWENCRPQCITETMTRSNESVIGICWRESYMVPMALWVGYHRGDRSTKRFHSFPAPQKIVCINHGLENIFTKITHSLVFPVGWLSFSPVQWIWRTSPWTSKLARCSWKAVSRRFGLTF